MQRIKDLHQLQHFPTTLKLLTMCMRPDFLDTLLKEPNGFSKYVKSLINYSIIRELLPQYGRKDLVTNIFFEPKDMCIAIVCKPGCDVMNFEVNLSNLFNQAVFPT